MKTFYEFKEFFTDASVEFSTWESDGEYLDYHSYLDKHSRTDKGRYDKSIILDTELGYDIMFCFLGEKYIGRYT